MQVFHLLSYIYSLVLLFFFDVVVNKIVFLISSSDNLLLMYRNAKEFLCVGFVFCNITEFVYKSNSFLMEMLGVSLYSLMSSANSNSFTSSFPIWIPFNSSSGLIVLDRTSNTILNNSGDNENPCLISDF